MSVTISPPMFLQFFDPNNSGSPLVGGKLFTYIAGTTTKQATWTDSTQVTQNNNPIILDANGAANVWPDPSLIYKYVLAPANDTDPPASPLHVVDNIESAITNRVLTQALISPVLFPRTAAEIAAGVTPTNYSYLADPYIDPRRYGADPTGVADATTAVQNALNVALQAKGCVWIGNACTYLVGALSLTMASGQSIRILGSSTLGSKLQAKAGLSATAILTLKTSAPATSLIDSFTQLESFTIQGPVAGITTGVHGLSLQGLSKVELSAMRIAGHDRGIDAQNVLTWTLERNTEISLNNVGINFLLVGTLFTANLWRIHDCQINLNNNYGISYNKGTGLYISQCDFEANGTSATFTGNPLIGATSGTLTATWPLITGGYACYFPDGETRTVTLTQGATTATWAGGLAAGQTAAWLGTPTNAILIDAQCSPDLLEGNVVIERCWFEGNKGGWAVNHIAQSNGNHQRLRISSCEFINNGNGQCLMVGGAYFLDLENIDAEGNVAPNIDTFNLTANSAVLKNIFVASIIDSGIGTPWYLNVGNATLGGKPTNGRYDTFTGTLTGCTTSPTATVQVVQQGQEVSLILPDLTATSNTTACTITGLPAKYQPTGAGGFIFMPCIVENNGTDNIQMALFTNGSGTIILYQGGSQTGFTNAGGKGIRRQNLTKYRLDI